jgi:hypothetical protein
MVIVPGVVEQHCEDAIFLGSKRLSIVRGPSNCDLGLLIVGDNSVAGQQAVVIQHQVQLDGALPPHGRRPVRGDPGLGAAELSPVE